MCNYADMAAVLEDLPKLLSATRKKRGLTLRAASEQMDVNINTLSRLEHEHHCSLYNVIAILKWLESDSASDD